MDDDARPHDVDRELRAALAPAPDVVTRVVTGALSATRHRQPAAGARWRLGVAAILVVVGTAVWWQLQSRPPTSPSSLMVVGGESMLVVHSDDGRRWLIGPGAERPTTGHFVIVVQE